MAVEQLYIPEAPSAPFVSSAQVALEEFCESGEPYREALMEEFRNCDALNAVVEDSRLETFMQAATEATQGGRAGISDPDMHRLADASVALHKALCRFLEAFASAGSKVPRDARDSFWDMLENEVGQSARDRFMADF